MTDFQSDFVELEQRELVRYLLRESGQLSQNAVEPEAILRFLKLGFLRFDFDVEFTQNRGIFTIEKPRALLSFPERIVAVDSALQDQRVRFSILHEIGHYVLPKHQHSLFICDDAGLGWDSRLVLEKEASDFAADLLFMGNRFVLEANSNPLCAATVKTLANKYMASFEATARRMVEKSFQPHMLIVFEQTRRQEAEELHSQQAIWTVRYCIASISFRQRFFSTINFIVPQQAAAEVCQSGRDIADSYNMEPEIYLHCAKHSQRFRAEYFFNQYNIFCLLSPA